MKKAGCLIITIIVIALIIMGVLGFLKGFGFGGSGNSQGSESVADSQSTTQSVAQSTAEETFDSTEKSDRQNVIAVTVAENEYLLDNQRVGLQEIETAIMEHEQEVIVKITDDNASRKAYRELVDLLDHLDVPYTEGD